MSDFFNRLYENDNFPIYLGAIIVVLIIAFFIVYFMGRKDQTKSLKEEKTSAPKNNNNNESSTDNDSVNTFKEITEAEKVEVEPENKNDSIDISNSSEVKEEKTDLPISMPIVHEDESFEKKEKDILNSFNDLANSIESELDSLEKEKQKAKPILMEAKEEEIELPNSEENKTELVKDEEPIFEDTMDIELPKLR